MRRSLAACLAGIVTWIVVAWLINRTLRIAMTGYSAAEPLEQYTLAMKWARLLMAFAASLAAGAAARLVSPSRWAPWAVGGIALAIFVPLHISIWIRFPPWYHLTFLLSQLPAVLMGALLARRRESSSASL